ncbi:copper-binding protein [Novosphingobium sp. HR1a]|uniref:copper-binding protein n=1 Tax=Novosphingobium sp. HR1a TaxID=1395637 RepID=UPI0035C78ACA|nr:copper-binding protein [Novosphingobium sp. HR1a]
MKLHALTVLALTAALAACGSKTETNQAAAANTAAPAAAENEAMAGDMGNMAKATGKVTAIDKSGGTITLDHGPIAEANWPAMTMAFKAAPALIDSVKVGDEVNFELKLDGNAGEVTNISKK